MQYADHEFEIVMFDVNEVFYVCTTSIINGDKSGDSEDSIKIPTSDI